MDRAASKGRVSFSSSVLPSGVIYAAPRPGVKQTDQEGGPLARNGKTRKREGKEWWREEKPRRKEGEGGRREWGGRGKGRMGRVAEKGQGGGKEGHEEGEEG